MIARGAGSYSNELPAPFVGQSEQIDLLVDQGAERGVQESQDSLISGLVIYHEFLDLVNQ